MSPNDTIEIQLTKGQVTVIDAIDASLTQHRWCVSDTGFSLYAARRNENGKHIYLHRFLMSIILDRTLLFNEKVDHINGNTLDNRRGNLRLATNSQNMMNRGKNKNNTSGYKGVTWDKRRNKWAAVVWLNNKNHFAGYYDDPSEAHEAYCRKARELHGDFFKAD